MIALELLCVMTVDGSTRVFFEWWRKKNLMMTFDPFFL